MKMNMMSG